MLDAFPSLHSTSSPLEKLLSDLSQPLTPSQDCHCYFSPRSLSTISWSTTEASSLGRAAVLTACPPIYMRHSSQSDPFEVKGSSWRISAQDLSLSSPALAKCRFLGTLSFLQPYPLCCSWLPCWSPNTPCQL